MISIRAVADEEVDWPERHIDQLVNQPNGTAHQTSSPLPMANTKILSLLVAWNVQLRVSGLLLHVAQILVPDPDAAHGGAAFDLAHQLVLRSSIERAALAVRCVPFGTEHVGRLGAIACDRDHGALRLLALLGILLACVEGVHEARCAGVDDVPKLPVHLEAGCDSRA
eukprot:CAMPEP_0198129564 /NCGR_PEP_ID=MMETSP1442-20131203/52028_1 /TAXON_ID= /ORGANISM="Craspedostauros australis, Strain CCMP3328" /LENGTH=167 /DNA_ID=CAMNT_0043789985 /DNA_START=440 /DNA_END=938 /DNA_ORIENTATION=-